jgi:hypothetical protein
MVDYDETNIDITPDDRIFTPRGVGALNIGVVECLSELVANSLDWRRLTKEEIERKKRELITLENNSKKFRDNYGFLLNSKSVDPLVIVRLKPDAIQILDNGIGMTLDDLEVGLRLRAADDTKREPLRIRKGMFGMGMKVGILGLGWKMKIDTRPLLESNKEHSLSINTRDIEHGKLKLKDIKVQTYNHILNGELHDWESGTSIIIEDLHKKKHDPITFREHLGLAFAPEIEYGGVKIIVIDDSSNLQVTYDPCEPKREPIDEDTKINLDSMNLFVRSDKGDGTRGDPVKIRGWIALRKKSGSGSGRWGIHTFRHGQLIEAYHNDGPALHGLLPKNPHPEFARLHGEIHLDMCDPNFTKVGWNTELLSWTDARDVLSKVLSEIMEASRKYRKKTKGYEAKRMLQQFNTAANMVNVSKSGDINESENDIKLKDFSEVGNGNNFPRISITMQDLTDFGDGENFWRYIYRKESNELAVFVNTDSLLWKYSVNHSKDKSLANVIIKWAISDSLYFCLTQEFNHSPNDAFMKKNSWLIDNFNLEIEGE